jgi:hypothetical protein
MTATIPTDKPFQIDKKRVYEAYKAVRSNRGAAGVDGQPLEQFDKDVPHKHPEDRVYTVISGVFYIGLGDQFDADKLQAYPPGSVIVLPGNTPHFHWARSGEYVSQVTAIGPLGLEYLDQNDDPRQQNR